MKVYKKTNILWNDIGKGRQEDYPKSAVFTAGIR